MYINRENVINNCEKCKAYKNMKNIYILFDLIYMLIEKIDLKNEIIIDPKSLLLINEYSSMIKSKYIEKKIYQYDIDYETLSNERNLLEKRVYEDERQIKGVNIDFINEFSKYLETCPNEIHNIKELKKIEEYKTV